MNLLSVSELLSNKSMTIHFSHNHFTIQDSHTHTIHKGKMDHGLYLLQSTQSSKPSLNISVNSVSVTTWHHRLGHLSFRTLYSLKSKLHSSHLNIQHIKLCYICPLAKQHRLPFTSNNHLSTSPFDLIHCNIWGPYQTTSHTGHRYFLTLVDDRSQFTWVYFLKNKSDALTVVPQFICFIQTQFHTVIKIFHSDNAPKLSFTYLFHTYAILHQFSCVELSC